MKEILCSFTDRWSRFLPGHLSGKEIDNDILEPTVSNTCTVRVKGTSPFILWVEGNEI
jgi:hypothetical protein